MKVDLMWKYNNQPESYKTAYIFEIDSRRMTQRDINAILKRLRRQTKKNPFFSWYAVSSTTNSKSCRTCFAKSTGGRPSKKVLGEKVPLHLHIFAVSTNPDKSPWTDCEAVAKSVKKSRACRLLSTQSRCFLKYEARQADHTFKGGNYDFKYFLTPDYFEPYLNTFEDKTARSSTPEPIEYQEMQCDSAEKIHHNLLSNLSKEFYNNGFNEYDGRNKQIEVFENLLRLFISTA